MKTSALLTPISSIFLFFFFKVVVRSTGEKSLRNSVGINYFSVRTNFLKENEVGSGFSLVFKRQMNLQQQSLQFKLPSIILLEKMEKTQKGIEVEIQKFSKLLIIRETNFKG